MDKRVLILTGTTDILCNHEEYRSVGFDGSDNSMEEVFELTLPSKVRYAKKYGYDLLALRSFGTGGKYGFKDTNIGFLRAVRTFELLAFYDVVMWVDADAIITNDSYSIESFGISSNHCFYASYDWAWKNTFSTGNFIIQRTQHTATLFKAFLEIGKNFTVGLGEEQKTMNYIYQNTNLRSLIKIHEHKYLNAVPTFEPYWPKDRIVISPWNEECFLAHLTGNTNLCRINCLKKELSKFL